MCDVRWLGYPAPGGARCLARKFILAVNTHVKWVHAVQFILFSSILNIYMNVTYDSTEKRKETKRVEILTSALALPRTNERHRERVCVCLVFAIPPHTARRAMAADSSAF